jgi:hypothetical protein
MSMRKRQEVQKVSRRNGIVLGLALLAGAGLAGAAVLPDQFAGYRLVSKGQVDISDRPVWDEYGFQTAERGDFASSERKVNVSVWQMKDTTGALAAMQWLQPGVVQHGNYVLRVDGQLPPADLAQLEARLPKVDRAANPVLPAFLPDSDRVRHSERYVLGPASLSKFEPRIPADLAGFDKGAEAQLARYKIPGGETQLLLLSYPTPQIAGQRFREFINRQWKARRYGPMVGVVLDAPPENADKLLSGVAYQPKVTWSEKVPKNENPGDMILAICILAGALMVASLVLGLLFGGLRQVFGSRFGVQAIDDNFTSLHIEH